MNTNISELKQQKLNINNNLENELKLSYKFYLEYRDTDFKVEDHYLKFILFSVYRSIESLIYLLVQERKFNSISKNFYQLICDNNIKAFFIKLPLLKTMFDDIQVNNISIKYIEIFESMKDGVLSNTSISVKKINDIKPSSSNKNDSINIEHFYLIYKDCCSNRNKIIHSITEPIDLTKNSIINAFVIYTFFDLILEKIF